MLRNRVSNSLPRASLAVLFVVVVVVVYVAVVFVAVVYVAVVCCLTQPL